MSRNVWSGLAFALLFGGVILMACTIFVAVGLPVGYAITGGLATELTLMGLTVFIGLGDDDKPKADGQ